MVPKTAAVPSAALPLTEGPGLDHVARCSRVVARAHLPLQDGCGQLPQSALPCGPVRTGPILLVLQREEEKVVELWVCWGIFGNRFLGSP